MKQYSIALLCLCCIFSCSEKIVQLPATTNKTITEVLDVSPVYMFYSVETGEIEFNRKNMISTTNWLVNIDKRLTLDQIFPHLKYLQEKRQGDGMHKNENARNYFTCNNTELKNLAFIDFTNATFKDQGLETYLQKMEVDNTTEIIQIDFKASHGVEITKKNSEFILKTDQHSWLDLLQTEVKNSEAKKIVILKFSPQLNFQDYIDYKTRLLQLKNENVIIANDEFIHN